MVAKFVFESRMLMPLFRLRLRRPTIITLADRARDAREWQLAAGLYRTALAYEPADADAHLQLGHALKLQGKRGGAEVAYRHAWVLDPSSAEAARELSAFGWTRQRLAEAADHSAAAPAGDDPPATAAINGAMLRFRGRRGREGLIT